MQITTETSGDPPAWPLHVLQRSENFYHVENVFARLSGVQTTQMPHEASTA